MGEPFEKVCKAIYKHNIFIESTTTDNHFNINTWKCSANNCPSILYTKKEMVINFSGEHNHPNNEESHVQSPCKYKCSVRNCYKKAPEVDLNGFPIVFLMFPPKNHNIWKYWVNFCNNGPEWEPKPSSYICSVSIYQIHFLWSLCRSFLILKIHFENNAVLPTLNKSDELVLLKEIDKRGYLEVNTFNEAIHNLKEIEHFLLTKEKYKEVEIITKLEKIFDRSNKCNEINWINIIRI